MVTHDEQAPWPEIPEAPPTRLTPWDVTMLIGMPGIAYLGGIASGLGNAVGLVLAGFAALGIVTFRTFRIGRRNEPRIPPYTHYVAIAVAVITFTTAWGLYSRYPQPDPIVYLLPLGPVALFALLVALMFRRPR